LSAEWALLFTIILVILLFHIAVVPVLWLASLLAGLPWLWRHLSQSTVAKWAIIALVAVAITAVFLKLFESSAAELRFNRKEKHHGTSQVLFSPAQSIIDLAALSCSQNPTRSNDGSCTPSCRRGSEPHHQKQQAVCRRRGAART
jgi:hypothetical protein